MSTGIHLLTTIRELYGNKLWRAEEARPDFFDKLFGSDATRLAILDGDPPERIIASWKPEVRQFKQSRGAALLYKRA